MTSEQIQELKVVCSVYWKLQSALHSMDELPDTNVHKMHFKQRTNAYAKVVESTLDKMNASMNIKEMDLSIEIVAALDKICDDVTFSHDPEN